MDRTAVVLLLYSLAGLLETVGVLTIAFDLRARRRRVLTFDSARHIIDLAAKASRERGWFAEAQVVDKSGKPPTPEERLATLEAWAKGEHGRIREVVDKVKNDVEADLRDADREVDRQARKRDDEIIELVGPGETSWPGWLGFAGLLSGVVVGTVANALSATAH